MEPYHQILARYFASSDRFEQDIHAPEIVEGICYRTICAIRDILADSANSDEECFQKIEQIVLELEKIGCGAGARHDFG